MSEGAFRTTLVLGGVFALLMMANRWVLILLVALELLAIGGGALYFLSQHQKMSAALHERDGQLEDARRQIADLGVALQALRLGRPAEVDVRSPLLKGVGGSRAQEDPTWPGMRSPIRPRV